MNSATQLQNPIERIVRHRELLLRKTFVKIVNRGVVIERSERSAGAWNAECQSLNLHFIQRCR